jgi:hypothetical protein
MIENYRRLGPKGGNLKVQPCTNLVLPFDSQRNRFGFSIDCRLMLRMKDDQQRFLSLLGQLPTRLTAEQAGWMLNCQPHDIPALVRSLGNAYPNCAKYFIIADVLEMTKDCGWLVKVTNTACQYRQNRTPRKAAVTNSQNGHPATLELAEVQN